MDIISKNELMRLETKFSYYDFSNHESEKTRIRVTFRENIDLVRFGDIDYGGDELSFISKANILQNFVTTFIENYYERAIVSKYNDRWITNVDASNIALYNSIKKVGGRNNFGGAFKLEGKGIIRDFVMENFRYYAFTYFLLPKSQIVIVSTDHLDVFLAPLNIIQCVEKVELVINGIDAKEILKYELIN